jgi:[ribosomal protein S5]-alanine N-acetyltransferase
MATLVIPTARLDLKLQTPDEVLAWLDTLPPADRAEVSPDWVARVRGTAPGDYWALAFTVVDRATATAVGACAFKGPPDAAGVVEVAYGIDPPHRGRGFATEAAAGLAGFALAASRAARVRAHSKPDNVASARVLEKCGFIPVGEVVDPEDGLVRRWERGPDSTVGDGVIPPAA